MEDPEEPEERKLCLNSTAKQEEDQLENRNDQSKHLHFINQLVKGLPNKKHSSLSNSKQLVKANLIRLFRQKISAWQQVFRLQQSIFTLITCLTMSSEINELMQTSSYAIAYTKNASNKYDSNRYNSYSSFYRVMFKHFQPNQKIGAHQSPDLLQQNND